MFPFTGGSQDKAKLCIKQDGEFSQEGTALAPLCAVMTQHEKEHEKEQNPLNPSFRVWE